MCINTSIKPTSADLLKRFAENAPHQRQVAGMTVHGPSRWRHSPLAARRWELPAWLRRYLLAEVMGLLVASIKAAGLFFAARILAASSIFFSPVCL